MFLCSYVQWYILFTSINLLLTISRVRFLLEALRYNTLFFIRVSVVSYVEQFATPATELCSRLRLPPLKSGRALGIPQACVLHHSATDMALFTAIQNAEKCIDRSRARLRRVANSPARCGETGVEFDGLETARSALR